MPAQLTSEHNSRRLPVRLPATRAAQWFYAAYEFFLVVVTALVAIPKLGGHLNMGVIGLLAVGVVLFIDVS